MKKIQVVNILVLLASQHLVAQADDSLKVSRVQVSFAYPVSTQGKYSLEYANNVSFNILFGLNRGLNEAEIGTILNYNKEEVRGFQLSGVSNINGGFTKGFLFSGISNICLDSSAGLLVSGVLNYSKKSAKGVQVGTINFVARDFKGLQAGVFNYATKLKGVQFGVFNYLQDGKGALPIGLFSVVKNGHYEFEITGGEAIFVNLNYKMGVERFYTIFKSGYSVYKGHPIYSLGLGFGRNTTISEKHKVSTDLSFNHIIHKNNWSLAELNVLNKADVNYKFSVSGKVSLLAGPSFNVYLTKVKVNGQFGTLNIPYASFTNEGTGSKLFMWMGINAGVSVKL